MKSLKKLLFITLSFAFLLCLSEPQSPVTDEPGIEGHGHFEPDIRK